jgi:hypothetical protein
MTDLKDIMNRSTSDKGNGLHNYTTFYSMFFEPIRYNNLNVLEIGIGSVNFQYPGHMGWWKDTYKPGASIKGWKQYFTNSMIYGCDIDRDVLFTEDRIETFYLDQTSSDSIKQQICDIDREYDIIIDDGMHHFPTNFNVLKQIYCKLKPGGYYVIEDICDFDEDMFNTSDFAVEVISKGDFCAYIKLTNPANNNDNNIVVLRKK